MISLPSHNLVAVETSAPLQTLAAVEGGQRVEGGLVACPATLANLQGLRKAGHVCLPPMDLHGYDWPIYRGWKVLPHQRVTANFLALNPRAFCLNDMGSMKTLSALWAADYLIEMHRRQGIKMRVLVVAPLSILSTTWQEAIFRHFIGRRTCVVLTGSAEKRRKLLEKDVDFYIINHDGLCIGVPSTRKSPLEGLAKDLSLRSDIRLGLIDEASAYRNATTRRHKAARALLRDRPYLWLMTGTPTPNGPTDAYGMAKLVNDAHGETFTNYKQRVMMNVSQFKWVPRAGAAQEANKLLQPAVRFSIEDCVELPPCTVQQREVPLSAVQAKAYQTLKHEAVLAMQSGALVHAVNEAALRQKLIQVACLAEGTSVLTPAGWWPIERVLPGDLVWDGETWVPHSGCICRGEETVVETDGVWTTPDHLLLSTRGWREAERFHADAGEGLKRVDVRVPDGFAAGWNDIKVYEKSDLVVRMLMWDGGCAREPESSDFSQAELAALRLSRWRNEQNARHVKHAPISYLDAHEAPLHGPNIQGLQELRRARDFDVRGLVRLIREFLARYAGRIFGEANYRPRREQRELRAGQLPLGDRARATTQSALAGRATPAQTPKERDAPEKKTALVYDLVDCGPRNRFVVRDKDGRGMIVHNCGAIYDSVHDSFYLDPGPRIAEVESIIEETDRKVVIFAPLTNVVHMLHERLSKEYVCEMINGEVKGKARDDVIRRFGDPENPLRIIVVDPGTVSHGINQFVTANVAIWYGPTDKTEQYLQANKRIDRPGQTVPTTIIQLVATKTEKEIFARLEANQSMQGVVLKLAEE